MRALSPCLLATLLTGSLLACQAPEDEEQVGTDPAALGVSNGVQLNGVQLNGVQLNGVQLNGVQLNGVQLNGAQLNGTVLSGVLSSGGTIALRIDSFSQDAADPELAWYGVSFAADDGWHPLCPGDNQAMAVAGVWSYAEGVPGGGSRADSSEQFTFSCAGGAIAKCVTFGYKPWRAVGGEALVDHHQACTRAVRADYCGDGRSHTYAGRPINLYDDLAIQSDTETWRFEAEWDTDGALCLRAQREAAPECAQTLLRTRPCGSFRGGALLLTELER